MKPPPFDYHRASNLSDALAALAQHGDRAKLLAGGQSLIPMLNLRVIYPERLIDIGRLDELRYVKRAGNELRIGALCTHNTVMEFEGGAERVSAAHGGLPSRRTPCGAQPRHHRRQPLPQ